MHAGLKLKEVHSLEFSFLVHLVRSTLQFVIFVNWQQLFFFSFQQKKKKKKKKKEKGNLSFIFLIDHLPLLGITWHWGDHFFKVLPQGTFPSHCQVQVVIDTCDY